MRLDPATFSRRLAALRTGSGSGSLRENAFSLVELMVVLVLIAILSAMILPEMRGSFEDALLRSTSRKLATAFQLAHSQAITVSVRHRVRIDTASGRYFIEAPTTDSGSSSKFVALKSVHGAEGTLDPRIAIEIRKGPELDDPLAESEPADGPTRPVHGLEPASEAKPESDSVTFHPDGTAERSEIVLRDRQGFGLRLRIQPATSHVRISSLNPAAPTSIE